jgi:hypothetical protein
MSVPKFQYAIAFEAVYDLKFIQTLEEAPAEV